MLTKEKLEILERNVMKTGGLGSLDRKQGFISEKLLWFVPQPVSAEFC